MTNGIAIVGIGRNSYTNPSVVRALTNAFPEYTIDWLDLHDRLSRRTHNMVDVMAALAAAREFGVTADLRKRRLWTTYMFELRSRVARAFVSKRRYRFSLQIQSLFDAGIPGTPHFVYTDHTMLANRRYPDTAPKDIPVTQRWLNLERSLYHNARLTFVMSTNVAQSLIDDYQCDPSSIVRAYAGPNAPVSPTAEKRYDGKRILFVGKEWRGKGGPELLAAFKIVRQTVPDARLTIVGCSPKLNDPGCDVVGRVPPAQLMEYYRNASVFCLPTRREAFGIVFLEAMGYALPIVASDIGAIPDFVHEGENGFRIPLGDVGLLARRLTTLVANPSLCATMGARSAQLSGEYTWERTAAIMREAIERSITPQAASAV